MTALPSPRGRIPSGRQSLLAVMRGPWRRRPQLRGEVEGLAADAFGRRRRPPQRCWTSSRADRPTTPPAEHLVSDIDRPRRTTSRSGRPRPQGPAPSTGRRVAGRHHDDHGAWARVPPVAVVDARGLLQSVDIPDVACRGDARRSRATSVRRHHPCPRDVRRSSPTPVASPSVTTPRGGRDRVGAAARSRATITATGGSDIAGEGAQPERGCEVQAWSRTRHHDPDRPRTLVSRSTRSVPGTSRSGLVLRQRPVSSMLTTRPRQDGQAELTGPVLLGPGTRADDDVVGLLGDRAGGLCCRARGSPPWPRRG